MSAQDSSASNPTQILESSASDAVAFPTAPALSEPTDDLDLIPYLLEMVNVEERRSDFLMRVVIPLGAALVQETDFNHLLERILVSAMTMSRADGGVLYLRDEDGSLRIALFRRESLGIELGGTSGKPLSFSSILPAGANLPDGVFPLAARAAALGKSVCEYRESPQSAFSIDANSALRLDQINGYHVMSALAVPLRDSRGEVAGVIELSNARRDGDEKPVPFETAIQRAVEALCLLAAAAVQSYLKQENLRDQVRELRVQVDSVKKNRQVEAIVRSDYFQSLKARARDLRNATLIPIQQSVESLPVSADDRS